MQLPPLKTDVATMIAATGCQHIWSRFTSFHSPIPIARIAALPVTFDMAGNAGAGQYRSAERRIRLNIALRAKFNSQHLIATFLHELAHAADRELNGRADGHNANWCALMGQLGQRPEMYHSINLRANTAQQVNPEDLGL